MLWFCRIISSEPPWCHPCQPGTLCACEVWALQAASEADGWEVPFLSHKEFINLGFFFLAQPWVAICRCLPWNPLRALPYKMPWFFSVLMLTVSKRPFPQPCLTFLFWFTLFIPEQMIPKAIIRKQALKHSTRAHLLRVVAGEPKWHKIVLQVSKKKEDKNLIIFCWHGVFLCCSRITSAWVQRLHLVSDV